MTGCGLTNDTVDTMKTLPSNVRRTGTIVLRKPVKTIRKDWAAAARAIAAHGGDELLMGEFANAADAELSW